MDVARDLRSLALLVAIALPLRAQEPRPALLFGSYFASPEGVILNFAWRFAPGDGAGRELPQYDDANWSPIKPALEPSDLPPGGWPGAGWFRRHLMIDPSLQRRTLALRFAAPGTADVYLDGRLVLRSGRAGAPPEIPAERREASLVTFPGRDHVLAVRYVYPKDAPRPGGIGFQLSLADPALSPRAGAPAGWRIALQGAIVALPLFLVFLHLTLFTFSPRARENLFYAGEMAAFGVILLHEYEANLFPAESQRAMIDLIVNGGPVMAVLFGVLTYYAVRTNPFPRSWRLFVGAGLVLFATSYLAPNPEYGWMLYFFAVIVEVIRLERGGRTVQRKASRIFMVSFLLFGLMIVLQILVNYRVLESVAGVREVYVFGIVVSAIGMSLYLARTVGQSRLVELENERKTIELTQARELQLSMLPRELPRVPGLDVAVLTQTAAEVGGDYYDIRPAGEGALLFAFGDATGHGLASGIVVTAAKALFASLQPEKPLRDLLSACDRALRRMQLPALRMCLALARVSPSEAAVASAAMPPVLIHRPARGAVEELGVGGLPLGSHLPVRYEEQRAALAPGDTLLFASDGFAELLDPNGHQLGYRGVAAVFGDAATAANAHEIVQQLVSASSDFRGSRPQDDDITFVVVRVTR